MALATEIYESSKNFPPSENYGLKSQMQRAAVSIPSNIAEGQARSTTKDFIKFLIIARGSLAELETQLLVAKRLNYLNNEQINPISEQIQTTGKLINGLINALKKRYP